MSVKKKLVLILTILIVSAPVAVWFYFKPSDTTSWLPKISKIPTVKNLHVSFKENYPPWESARPEETFNFPIKLGQVGPIRPLFAKAPEYPFYCRSIESGLGQPLVDNEDGYGIPIYEREYTRETEKNKGAIVGYSKDCSIPTQVRYFYNRKGTEKFFPIEQANNDITQIEKDGISMDLIVRLEVGTINRFLYSILTLKGKDDTPEKLDASFWNKRLIYFFQGGVGIGRQQGRLKYQQAMGYAKQQLIDGYAILYSTGTQTSVHYDIELAEDTALRVKKQFTSQYGEPLYTVGVGGSGGAIQQYLFAQNNPGGVIDAAIPLYAYPDMVTQTIYSFDCELLEHYFDEIDESNRRWRKWENRSLIEGLNASSESKNRFARLEQVGKLSRLEWPRFGRGASECTNGWRGLTPLVHNPNLLRHRRFYTNNIIKQVHWTYWEDLKGTFGSDQYGYAKSPWDNVGVQYGLASLKNGDISIQEFLKLNSLIGGWKEPHEMKDDNFWFFSGNNDPRTIDIYSSHNMTRSVDGGYTPAPRTKGDEQAINSVFRSGNVFLGAIDIPILEVRHYLDDVLDMHHLSSSFSARLRIMQTMRNADHHVLWVTRKPYSPIKEAFELMDEWMLNIINNRDKSIVANKPRHAVDSCFDREGRLISSGDKVWDGAWNHRENGECSRSYLPYPDSRVVSGASWLGYTFKCKLQSVDSAIAQGSYGEIDMQAYAQDLRRIFPEGVCDYARGGVSAKFIQAFVKRYRKGVTQANKYALLGSSKDK